MFIVLLVYQSPPLSLSFPVLILPGGGGGVGFVNLNSPLSLEGGNIQRMSFEFPDYSFSLLIAALCDLQNKLTLHIRLPLADII